MLFLSKISANNFLFPKLLKTGRSISKKHIFLLTIMNKKEKGIHTECALELAHAVLGVPKHTTLKSLLSKEKHTKIGGKKVHFVPFKTMHSVRPSWDSKKLWEVSPEALNLVGVKTMTKNFVISYVLTVLLLRLENTCGSFGGFSAAVISRIFL